MRGGGQRGAPRPGPGCGGHAGEALLVCGRGAHRGMGLDAVGTPASAAGACWVLLSGCEPLLCSTAATLGDLSLGGVV